MVVANKSSKYVWAYQAAVGTSIITAVDTTTYEFGEYNDECEQWNAPHVENPIEAYWVYGSKTCTLTDLCSEYPVFTHTFLPVTAQFLAWILGYPTDTSPTVTIAALTSGMTYPLTIRNEELEGTNPNNAQAVDCYCIGITAKAERGRSFLVAAKFAWGALEDIGDNPNLTTAPLAAGGMTGPYDGNPIVYWDTTGDNVNLPGVWRADFNIDVDWESVSSSAGNSQTVYTYKIQPVEIILYAVFAINDSWDDYVDRKAATTMTIQVKKHDGTSNILLTFTNCRIISHKKTGERNKGHYASYCVIKAEKVEGVSDWFTEGGTPFATHWKAQLT